jgi:hypothetical protein
VKPYVPIRRVLPRARPGLPQGRNGAAARARKLKPSKKKSTERIDGIVATIMALGRAMVRDTNESDGVLKVI